MTSGLSIASFKRERQPIPQGRDPRLYRGDRDRTRPQRRVIEQLGLRNPDVLVGDFDATQILTLSRVIQRQRLLEQVIAVLDTSSR